MARKEIDGVEYVTKKYGFGEHCDISSTTMKTEYVDGKPFMRADFGVRTFMVVMRGLKSWTFKGVDGDGNVKTEGEVLPITDETVRKIPPKHGETLYKIIQSENEMSDDEIKNSPGQ